MKRYIFLCIGLMIMAFGVAFSIKANLGTSPISSVPYVVNRITPLSVGNATIIMHCIFILLQIIILRKKYEIVQLMQLPIAIIFGYLTDFAIFVLQNFTYHTYFQQCLFCLLGIILVAVGVSFEVTANVVTLAGEGLVLAICKVFSIKFGNMKVLFDISLVCTAVFLSLLFNKNIIGVREGTLTAAILIGIIAKRLNHPLEKIAVKAFV